MGQMEKMRVQRRIVVQRRGLRKERVRQVGQRKQTKMTESSEGLMASAKREQAPRESHRRSVGASLTLRARVTRATMRRVERLVSQKTMGKKRSAGLTAQMKPARLAAAEPKRRWVRRMRSRTVAAPKQA